MTSAKQSKFNVQNNDVAKIPTSGKAGSSNYPWGMAGL